MSDSSGQTPPPPPEQPAAEAAARPPADPDDTGVPGDAFSRDLAETGKGFFAALFDVSFRTFITRRLASVFYIVGLIAIAIGFVYYFVGGLISGFSALWWNPGAGIGLILSTLIIVPLLTFLSVIVLRFVIEGVVALIAIAENTERTAQNTRR